MNYSFNQTEEELFSGRPSVSPQVLLLENKDSYVIITSILIVNGTLLNLYIIVQICRFEKRRTLVNFLLAFGRFISMGTLLHPILCLLDNPSLCLWVYIIFPGLILFEKFIQSSQAFARYLYIFCDKLMSMCGLTCLAVTLVLLVIFFASIPYLTLIEYYPTLFVYCEPHNTDNKPSNYQFLFLYFVVFVNSLISDVVCYTRILNYMRQNSVRVTVVATTALERQKGKNLITAPSSLLIWLITVVSMIPASILQLRSPPPSPSDAASDTVTLFNFQLCLVFIQTSFLPILYIGSSGEMRQDIGVNYQKLLVMVGLSSSDEATSSPTTNGNNGRQNVYAISNDFNLESSEERS